VTRWSLATRLVVGIVALLAVLAVGIAIPTVAASRGQTVGRLDGLLIAASDRSTVAVNAGASGPGSIIEILPGQGAGAIGMVIFDDVVYASGYIGTDGSALALTEAQQRALEAAPDDRTPTTVDLGGLGSYRVVSTPLADGRIVVSKTASIDGDLSAPAVSIDDGALLQGRLEIAGRRASAV